MPSNEYYDHTTYPANGAQGSSSAMRTELESIEDGFDKLPTLTGNGSKIVRVNAGATALEAVSAVPAAQMTVMVGDSGSGGTQGAAPAPGAGDAAANKFLKSDGTWAVTPGVLTVVSVTNAAAAASVAFTSLASGYDYRVRYNGVFGSVADKALRMKVSVDNGANYLAADYWNASDTTAATSGETFISLSPSNNIQTALPESVSGEVFIVNPADAANYKHIRSKQTARSNVSSTMTVSNTDASHVYVGATTAIDAIQFVLSGGNITGTFILEKIARAA